MQSNKTLGPESELRMIGHAIDGMEAEFDYIENNINSQARSTDVDLNHLARLFDTARENVLLVHDMFGDAYETLRQAANEHEDREFQFLFAKYVYDCIELAITRLEKAHNNLEGIFRTLDEREPELREAMSGMGDPVTFEIDALDEDVLGVLGSLRNLRREMRGDVRESQKTYIDTVL